MIEGDDPRDEAERLTHGEIHRVRSHRDRRAFNLGHKTGEEFELRCDDIGVGDHLRHRIAAVCDVDRGKVARIRPKQSRDLLENACAFQGSDVAPDRKSRLGRGDRTVDVRIPGLGEAASTMPRPGSNVSMDELWSGECQSLHRRRIDAPAEFGPELLTTSLADHLA